MKQRANLSIHFFLNLQPGLFAPIRADFNRRCSLIDQAYSNRLRATECGPNTSGSAQARALEEWGREYILPIVVAAGELPGMQPTTGYLNFPDHPVERIAEILKQKLNS